MASKVASHVGRANPIPKRKPAKDKDYLAFIHLLPCCLTGREGVEAAHISFPAPHYGHYGRALSHKASDRWCVPLNPAAHAAAHAHTGSGGINEQDFWRKHGRDPHLLALILWGLFCEAGNDSLEQCISVIMSRDW